MPRWCTRASARIGWIILVCGLACAPGRAQRYSFSTVTQAQGLTDLGINTVLPDWQGFIWIGGNNGLFRYDGSRVIRFGVSSGLPAEAISALIETSDHTLWVATGSGIARREGDHFRVVDMGGVAPERGPETMAEDRLHGGMFVATSRGLLRLATSGGREWVAGTVGGPVWSVFTDAAGATWYAESEKICSISPESRCYGSADGVPKDAWGGLAVDHSGAVWARSAEKLIVLERGRAAFRRSDAGLPYVTGIGALALDPTGGILVPTGIGLAVPNGERWNIVGREEGLIVPTVSWAIGDREGSIWIAMRGGGVACWRGPGEWQNWTTLQGLKSDEIWAITRDRKQNLLVSTTLGVNVLKHGRFEPLFHIGRALSRDRVLTMMVDNSDDIWIGAVPNGLFRYNRSTRRLTHFTEKDGMPAETIFSIAGSNGNIWVGGMQGVYRGLLVNGRWKFHKETITSGRNAEYFDQVLLDRRGRVWAAGSNGLACWRDGTWSRVRFRGAVVGRAGARIAEAPDGAIWLAGADSSDLTRIAGDAPDWQITVDTAPRVFGPQVTYFLDFDRAGNLWRGTGLGVQAHIRQRWVRYTQADGLVWDDTDINAFYADSDNSVWIGTTGGLSHHLPATAISAVKPVTIVGASIGGRQFDQPHSCTLRDGDGPVTIQFSVLAYRLRKDIHFRYRLSGFDRGWMETSNSSVSYSGLGPGTYTFEVESGIWNGPWSGKPATLVVKVTGPWWMSHWFAAAASGFVALMVILFWRSREGEHRRRENELAEAVRQRTEDLQKERGRDRASNAVLELVVSNQPLGTVLDAIGNLACANAPGSDFCILLRRGDAEMVASARGVPKNMWAAVASPGVIPFEAWRNASLAGSCDEPSWRKLAETLGSGCRHFASRLIGGVGAPLGILLITSTENRLGPAEEQFAAAARLARIAIEHASMYDNLCRQARHDPLTGLPNRLQVEEYLEMAIRESDAGGRNLALIYIDLDRFKEINDTLSHRAGDLYLQTIADRMKRAIRTGDIAGRIGGDEFNVIVPMIHDRSAAEEIANRILAEIRRPVTIEGHPIQGTASLGIAMYPEDATDAEELQRSADAAMYRAKTRGKDCVQAGSRVAEFPDIRMDQEIRAALDEHRVRVVYQPKVNKGGRVCGLEALVRIDHPVCGEIGPASFIPAAERSGLIVPLGAWVLGEVCRQIDEWKRGGLPVVAVAVNVSTVQICREDFADSVTGLLSRYGIDPEMIEIELTESFLMDGGEAPLRQIGKLRETGIRFSLDDFGSGYSSLSYLHRLNIDAIKLDRSFVQSMATDPGARRIVQGMIGVAEGMGLGVIGEGVETEEQRDLLVDAGCDVMQGYLFARPLPASDIENWLREAARTGTADLDRLDRALALAGAPSLF